MRDGDRNREWAGGEKGMGEKGEGTEESVRRIEAEISQGPAGAPKGTPGDAKCVTEIFWGGSGAKIRKLGWGQSLKLVS